MISMTEYYDKVERIRFIDEKVQDLFDAIGDLPKPDLEEDTLQRVLWLQEIIELQGDVIVLQQYIINNTPGGMTI